MKGLFYWFSSSILQWTPTLQIAAQQLQPEAQALSGGFLRVDPDEAGQQGSKRPHLWSVVVLITGEDLKGRGEKTWGAHTLNPT